MTNFFDLPDVRRRLARAMAVPLPPEHVAARLAELKHTAHTLSAMTCSAGNDPDLCCTLGAWERLQAMGETGFRVHGEPLPPAVIAVASERRIDPHALDMHVEGEHGWEPHDPGYADRVAEAADCLVNGCGLETPDPTRTAVGDLVYLPDRGVPGGDEIYGKPGTIVSIEGDWAMVDRGQWGQIGCPVGELRPLADGPERT